MSEEGSPTDHHVLDRTFNISIILKGLDGLIEVIGGILLLAVQPSTYNNLVVHFTQHELSRDPNDFVARHLLRLTADLHHTRAFAAIYLLSHGAIKVVLVAALLRRQLWAYPATLVFLAAFIGYQSYRMVDVPSVGLVLLTVFDLFVAWLVWREYELRRRQAA